MGMTRHDSAKEQRDMMQDRDDEFEPEDDYDDFADDEALSDRYLTFHLGEDVYGLEIRIVTEILGVYTITEVPGMPPFIKGVINLRGNVIPVVDVRLRFQMRERPYDERTCTIVVEVNSVTVGLIVDGVSEVAVIPEKTIEPTPKIVRGHKIRFIRGITKVGDNVKIILDANKLLYDNALAQPAAQSTENA